MTTATLLRPLLLSGLILTLICFNSCKNDTGSDSPVSPDDPYRPNNAVELSYVSKGLAYYDNSGVLVLDTVKILIKDIKLNVAQSNQQHNFSVGPYVLYLDVHSDVKSLGSEQIPDGAYDKVIFKIHKLGPNEPAPDPDFVDGNHRYSVVVKGTWDGVPFIFKSDKTVLQQLRLTNLLVVTGSWSNVTIQAQPLSWFINAATNEYLNPNDPQNRNEIEHNIMDNVRQNFSAFLDNDRNGRPD